MLSELGVEEIITVDGGSTDQTVERIKASELTLLRTDAGRAIQMNAGAAHARSDVLLFLHADTDISRCQINRIRQIMQAPEIIGGRFDVHLTGVGFIYRIIEMMMNMRSRITRISTGDQSIFVRREMFEHIGGFPNQPLMEDIEFSRKLKKTGQIACLRDKVTVSHRRWEKHGVVQTILLMWRLRLLYWLGVRPAYLKTQYEDH